MSSRSSIFSFESMTKVPPPTAGAVWASTLLLCVFAAGCYCRPLFDVPYYFVLTCADLGQFAVERFYHKEPSPVILIAGSCRNGMGCSRQALSRQMFALPAAKCTLDGASPWEVLAILKRFQNELSHLKIIIMDICPRLIQRHDKELFQKGNTLRILGSPAIPYPEGFKYKTEWVLQKKLSLRDILVTATYYNRSHESIWQSKRYRLAKRQEMVIFDRRTLEEIESERDKKRALLSDDFGEIILDELIDYCVKCGYLLVLNVTPERYQPEYAGGYFDFRDESTALSVNDKNFITLCRRLANDEDVVLLGCSRFSEIGITDDENTLFFDCYHTTQKGAELYTTWLADEMLKNAKIRRALELPPVENTIDNSAGRNIQQQETTP